jgi:putative oxidoreductase
MTANANTTSRLHAPSAGLLVIRSMLALVFMFHGAQKLLGLFGGFGIAGTAGFLESLGFPLPSVAAVVVGAVELFGGIALITGILFRPAALVMGFTMVVASLTAHTGFAVQTGGMEYPLTLAAVLTGLAFVGPGRVTVPALWSERSMRGRLDTADDAAGA